MDLLTNIINFTLDNRKERDYNQNPSLRKEKSEKFYGTKENSDKRRGCVSVSGGHQQFRRAFNATFGLWNFGDFKRAICVSTGAAEADSWNLDLPVSGTFDSGTDDFTKKIYSVVSVQLRCGLRVRRVYGFT